MSKRSTGVASMLVMVLFMGLNSVVHGDDPWCSTELGLAGMQLVSDEEGTSIRGAGTAFTFGDLSGFARPSFSSDGGFLWSSAGGAGRSGSSANSGTFVGWGSPLTFRVDQGGRSFRASLSGGLVGGGGSLTN